MGKSPERPWRNLDIILLLCPKPSRVSSSHLMQSEVLHLYHDLFPINHHPPPFTELPSSSCFNHGGTHLSASLGALFPLPGRPCCQTDAQSPQSFLFPPHVLAGKTGLSCALSLPPFFCMCVCVCVYERERETL